MYVGICLRIVNWKSADSVALRECAETDRAMTLG